MRGNFFEQTTSTVQENKILELIDEINLWTPTNLPEPQYLLKLQKELQDYNEGTEHENSSPRVKRALQKALKEIDVQLKNHPLTSSKPILSIPEYFIQIPSHEDISHMHGMPAGGKEDQRERLTQMVEKIKTLSTLPIITTELVYLTEHWNQLFAAIDRGKEEEAFKILDRLSLEDIILQSILSVHSLEYLQKIISCSIKAQRLKIIQMNTDILITPKTFEILIKDIATTIMNRAKLCFSFGLPTHHAYTDEGGGFCVLNKTAILMKHAESSHKKPLKYIIVGTDVNRDNGLCEILRLSASHMKICHVDIFDSRVYPKQDNASINEEFDFSGSDVALGIKCWRQNKLTYYAVDLSLAIRTTPSVHPALLFALEQIEKQLKQAKAREQKVMIYLPTGWDSHKDETAYCGKFINGKMMGKTAANKSRFNDEDLVCFYESILQLYQANIECIEGIYWGLEGGYDRVMYKKQIQLMLQTITDQLLPQDSSLDLNAMQI